MTMPPIDPDLALAARFEPVATPWGPDDVILYHLALGGGDPPTDERELRYVYERGLHVLPSFAVVPALAAIPRLDRIPGLHFDPNLMLHGEQEIDLPAPLPASSDASTTAAVVEVVDKGKAAVAVVETRTIDGSGAPLARARFSFFLRGAGGFGGGRAPRSAPAEQPSPGRPERPADVVVDVATLPQQAVLYRLCGDKNPLHADPRVAARAGFERPILHGLCSYGVMCKSVVDHALDGRLDAVAGVRARFAGIVYPGERLVMSMWREPGGIALEATTCVGAPVLRNGFVSLRS